MKWGRPYDPDVLRFAEAEWGFEFPPDLRELYELRRPVGSGFVDWETSDAELIRNAFRRPLIGLLFDVKHGFWLPEWGERPEQVTDREWVVSNAVSQAPKLIPIYGHRYIPSEPKKRGNPILSVYQTDIIVYGGSLGAYFMQDHNTRLEDNFWSDVYNEVPFWDRVADWHFDHWEPET